MKKIYIVLTFTGTYLSKIIKWWTKNEFSHVSISLDRQLQEMYSFGRKNAYDIFRAGLVHEYIDKGTFKRFKNTKCKIYSLEVTNKQYEIIKKEVLEMYDNKEKYKFNLLGLLCVSINKKVNRKNYYYCAEFVKHIFDTADVENNLPYIVKPEDFKLIKGLEEIYQGYLRDYEY